MIINADCIDAMRDMDADSIDAIVCDPPYGLEFMGKEWDRLSQPGFGERPTDWVSHSVTSRRLYSAPNRTCGTCGGRERGKKKCNCDQPRWKPMGRRRTQHSAPEGMTGGSTNRQLGLRMQEWHHAWATEALRVLKPGGHLLAFGGTRTYHRLACAVEDAGFEIRDSLMWVYGSGFPKSLDVSKAIDKAAGAEREVVGMGAATCEHIARGEACPGHGDTNGRYGETVHAADTAPATPEARRWQGWGTALKPAHEPIVVARKPLSGTVAANVLEYGTGALNVDGCRVGMNGGTTRSEQAEYPKNDDGTEDRSQSWARTGYEIEALNAGRWPANALFSHLPGCERVGTRRVKSTAHYKPDSEAEYESRGLYGLDGHVGASPADPDGTEQVEAWRCEDGCPVAELDRQSGECPGMASQVDTKDTPSRYFGLDKQAGVRFGRGDTGGASRFFYCAKSSRSERNAGLGGFEERETAAMQGNLVDGQRLAGNGTPISTPRRQNVHPTVKPLDLMRWLCRLVTPPGGTVLDPFAGSGTTGAAAMLEGFDFIGIEREAEYAAIAEARVKFWAQFPGADVDAVLASDAKAREIEASGQMGLL